jgi:hypothetical protein
MQTKENSLKINEIEGDCTMKKLLCLLLAMTMLMGSLFILSACDEKDKKDKDDEGESTEEVVASAPDVPKGYALYENDHIYFVYPEKWTPNSLGDNAGALILDGTTGNNITAVGEVYSNIYKDMTVESFNSLIKPSLDSQGLSVSGVKISQVKNARNTELTKISYTVKNAAGTSMKQTIYVVASGDLNYAINVTEVKSVSGLLDTVFNSIVSKK